jgi:hypothetical protein
MAFFDRRMVNVAMVSLLCSVLFGGIAFGQGTKLGGNASEAAAKEKSGSKGEKNDDAKNDNKGDGKNDAKDNKGGDKGDNKRDAKGDKKGDNSPQNPNDRGGQKKESGASQQTSKTDLTNRREASRRKATSNDNVSRSVDKVRSDWRDRDSDKLPFRFGWWNDDRYGRLPAYNPLNSKRWSDRPYYWWHTASPERISDWVVYRWQSPGYWDYGRDGYIYIEKDVVYRDGERYKAVDEYYNEIYKLAHSAPKISEAEAAEMDWMPLGVFAVVNEKGVDSGRVVQLAVSKKGIITGAYFDKEEDLGHPVEGMVDERTQTAAWAMADGTIKELVVETSIYNLTEPECTVMVHFGPKRAEVWQFVRLEEPASGKEKK